MNTFKSTCETKSKDSLSDLRELAAAKNMTNELGMIILETWDKFSDLWEMGEITKDKVNQHIRENVKNKLPELFT